MMDGIDFVSSSRARRPAWTRSRGALALVATAILASSIAVGWAVSRHLIAERDAANHDAVPQNPPRAEVVVLRLERGGESGPCHAFCAGEGLAWTAAHCVDGATTLRVVDAEGRSSAVDRVVSPTHDESSAGDVTHRAREDRAELSLRDATVCSTVPHRASIHRGDAVALRLFHAAPRLGRAGRVGSGLLATSPLVCAGDSGAPLVDREGALVGLAVGRSGLGCDEGASFFLALPPDASP